MLKNKLFKNTKASNTLSWKIAGEAGFGIKSAGIMLGKIFMRSGYEVFDYTEYPSVIRGGHNTFQLMVSPTKVASVTKQVDILVALNQKAITRNAAEVSKTGVIIYDQDKVKLNSKYIQGLGIPLTTLANQAGGEVMRNVVALGVTFALVKQDLTKAKQIIRENFKAKGQVVINNNIKALSLGFKQVTESKFNLPILKASQNILISANESLALGALASGLNFFVAYPMTPSSSILHYLAAVAEKTNIVVKHAEDEIAVINMALGAAHVGARAMVATSGGGFSLMTETLGLASITETPLVIVNVQRGGPATGMPTWTEQADLQFMIRAAQGTFPRIVLAPGDSQEAFELGAEALNLAEVYQLPVIILSDKIIAEGNQTVPSFKTNILKIKRGKLLTQVQLNKIKEYRRYRLTADGISPRTVPGMKQGMYLANSDEHDPYGYAEEGALNRVQQVDKRAQKLKTFSKVLPQPLVYGNPKAKKTIVLWGSTKGVVLDAYHELDQRIKNKIRIVQFQYMWPFAQTFTKRLLDESKEIMLIETNSDGQLGQLIAQETGIQIKNQLLKYDGRPFFREEILLALKKF